MEEVVRGWGVSEGIFGVGDAHTYDVEWVTVWQK